MIQIYDIGNENYDRNGNAVLTPTAGRVTMQAGGACDISLTLPMDPEGKWRHVVPGAVVKAPVPREVIENAFAGTSADTRRTFTKPWARRTCGRIRWHPHRSAIRNGTPWI